MAETKQINATVPADVVNAIVAYSKDQDRSFSYIVAQMLTESVERLKSPETAPKQKTERKISD